MSPFSAANSLRNPYSSRPPPLQRSMIEPTVKYALTGRPPLIQRIPGHRSRRPYLPQAGQKATRTSGCLAPQWGHGVAMA
jgi:hypothetical protein